MKKIAKKKQRLTIVMRIKIKQVLTEENIQVNSKTENLMGLEFKHILMETNNVENS